MKSSDMFRQVIHDFQYKPNFGIGLYEAEGQWRIRIVMWVENSRTPWKQWELGQRPQFANNLFDDYDIDFNRYFPPAGPQYFSPSREVIEVQGNFVIPPFEADNEQEFLTWLIYQVKGVEEHEMDEWIRYKGELVRDPHKPVTL